MQYILTQEEYDDLTSDKPTENITEHELIKPFLDPIDVRTNIDREYHIFGDKEVIFKVKFDDLHPSIIDALRSRGIRL